MSKKRKIKVGIVANEFLDPKIGRLGGFGWAAKKAAGVFNTYMDYNFEAIFLTPMPYPETGMSSVVINNTRLLYRSGKRCKDMLRLLSERIDILLTIDYRTDYDVIFDCLPKTPIVTWVRDPRSPEDINKMMSLKIPDWSGAELPGLHKNDSRQLSKYAGNNRLFSRKVILANKMPYLSGKNKSTYNLPHSKFVLPNPDVIEYDKFRHNPSSKPRVIFLGRLDPIKRPWLFMELARHFPHVEFLMLGKNHFKGEGWQPKNIPSNVKMLGHVSGAEKYNLLSSAWIMVNTSIHEESPVSVFEAIASKTPILSYEDWGGIVNRFGVTVGQHRGDGLTGIPAMVMGLNQLITNHEHRNKLGNKGHDYVRKEHNDKRFLSCFQKICMYALFNQLIKNKFQLTNTA